MLKVAMLFDYPFADRLGIDAAWHNEAYPMVNLIEGLQRNHEVDIDVVNTTRMLGDRTVHRISDRLRVHFLRVSRLSGMQFGYVPRVPLIHRYLEELQPDLVHGRGTEGQWGLATVTTRFPNVLTIAGLLREVHKVARPPLSSPLHVARWCEAWTLRKTRHVIAISPYVERALQGIAPKATYHHVPNAVARVFFDVEKKGIRPKVVFAARIGPHKGLSDFLEVAARLRERGVRATWTVLGKPGGPGGAAYALRCFEYARRAMPSQDVEFLGWSSQQQAAAALQDAACFVLPSYVENFSMALAEAMATGTPVVAYAVGGIPDYVEDGVNGFLVTPGDRETLSRRIETLLRDPDLARNLGERCREKARAFDPVRVAAQTADVYRKVLAG